MNFETLGLKPELLRALAETGFTTPTPIQAQAIPLIMEGHDVLGGAQTGTGKTAAFGLPMLQHLTEDAPRKGPRKPRVLILVPTRELAVQVAENIRAYGKHLKFGLLQIFGGVGMVPQVQELRRGTDVLVACPGRLLEHLENGDAKLDQIELLVLDEADRMLDMGFLPSMKRILNRVPKNRQTLLFSATFEPAIRALALEVMREPKEVQVAPPAAVAQTIVHRVHPVEAKNKRDLLVQILAERHTDRVLVFGKTKHGCNRLAEELTDAGLESAAIHGNKSQAARQRALNDFKSGKIRILVATDVAARGLDIPELPLVINHDLPMVPEDYVHRIGRTGRNGMEGEALSLVAPEEGPLLKQIQKMLKTEVELKHVRGFEPNRPLDFNGPMPVQQRGRQQPRGGGRGPVAAPSRNGGGGAGRSASAPRTPSAAHAARAGTAAPSARTPGPAPRRRGGRGRGGGGGSGA